MTATGAPRVPNPQPVRWTRVRYRVGQFLRGVGGSIPAAELSAATAMLPPDAAALFLRMPADAQRHSLNVLWMLQVDATLAPDLAAAALLHDVGKVAADDAGAYLGLWLRGPMVIAAALWPGLLRRLASDRPGRSLRYALYVQEQHPAIGAAWARDAGCSPLTCWLIEHHQDKIPAGDEQQRTLLAQLQAADEAN
jgi:hypothetical protein